MPDTLVNVERVKEELDVFPVLKELTIFFFFFKRFYSFIFRQRGREGE